MPRPAKPVSPPTSGITPPSSSGHEADKEMRFDAYQRERVVRSILLAARATLRTKVVLCWERSPRWMLGEVDKR